MTYGLLLWGHSIVTNYDPKKRKARHINRRRAGQMVKKRWVEG